jgi:hypothetical protein
MALRTILGLDLGQAHQFNAVAAVREAGQDAHGRPVWTVPLLQRWPMGTPYPEIVAEVANIADQLIRPTLVIDGTAVGRGVLDLFAPVAAQVDELVCVTITAGHQAHLARSDAWTVPKKDLIAAVQSVLQGRRLKIAKELREATTLTRELSMFRGKTTASATATQDNWRERDNDDLVLAVALAVWHGEFGPSPELNVVQLRLCPTPEARSAPRVIYAEIRYFSPHDSFQPMPQLDGEPLLGCPDFKTQEQTAYFLCTLYRELGHPMPTFTVELETGEQQAVERIVADFIRRYHLRRQTITTLSNPAP